MTRQKAWIVAAAATSLIVLLVLAAGASFGQFGLGGSGLRTGAEANTASGQTEDRFAIVGGDAQEREYRESGDDDEDDDKHEREGEDGDDDRGGEHERVEHEKEDD